ncbi:general substrate transporter [Mycolicibacterium mageritense DSM 44476 = CIP 104973]|uniref:MFS transporter n=1 Tax=Mycolicibacterium mageritense TaxID=53462 RepID=A0ABM7HWI6_MYCME|nr:MFS transporter [Mycolicibacterium mageritense]MCC9183155.1 MHS family MFS transporter [Mycolicibacterium mageritense]BBX34974.1 MFS transporter [Mycolicibacterium mageritense]CDO20510.1 general substrate transporter [Mycolicibacterium mageritense DSM 44476 = CIP 104973]
MTTVEQAPGTGVPRARIAMASMVGTTIEFYDFYSYATAAVLVFPQLFFPKGNPTTALLASLATFGLAFVARPLGSIIFGHFGDRLGRKATLVASLLVMGFATFVIGALPTYHQVGLLAPALLALMRFTQGLALGGEWSGAALLATETAAPERRGWAAMWPQLGAPVGFLIANGTFLVLISVLGGPKGAFLSWGWRIPFLLSAIMVAFGLYVRLRLAETPVFARAADRGERVKAPLAQLFRHHWYQLTVGTFAVVGIFSLFYIVTTWALGYGIAPTGVGLGFSYVEFLELQLISVLFFAATVPFTGKLIDRFGRRPVLLLTSVAVIAYGTSFALFLAPAHASRASVCAFLVIGMSLTGFAYGPLGAVLPELFPTNVRYTGSGVAFNVAGILGAAVAPFIATWLTAHYGVAYVGRYLIAMVSLTLVAQLAMKETRAVPLDSADGTR